MDGSPILLILSILLSIAAIKRVQINFLLIQEHFTVYFNSFGGINAISAYLSPALSLLLWLWL